MKKILYSFIPVFVFSILMTILIAPAKAAQNKVHIQYIVLPATVSLNADISLTICLVNQGDSGELINDGAENTDHVIISLPVGNNPDDLIDDSIGIDCIPNNANWICDPPEIFTDEVLLTFSPVDTVPILQGEMICFEITIVSINSVEGLTFLHVDQQFDNSRADNSRNGEMSIFKSDAGVTTETDPTVAASVKDGVSWTEVTNRLLD